MMGKPGEEEEEGEKGVMGKPGEEEEEGEKGVMGEPGEGQGKEGARE